jgi:MFS family permease
LAYPQAQPPMALSVLLRDMGKNREFLIFAIVTAIWNFSLNVAGPFFTPYLVQDLHADAAMVGLTSIASMVATMLVQRKLGELNDRWGARRLTLTAGLLIPLVPLLWVVINQAWHVILINLLSGALWGAFNLASFNYLLQIIPDNLRARFSALFQIIVTVSLAAGAALGSIIVTNVGYHAVFIGSGAGRMLAMLIFAFLLARGAKASRRGGSRPEPLPELAADVEEEAEAEAEAGALAKA